MKKPSGIWCGNYLNKCLNSNLAASDSEYRGLAQQYSFNLDCADKNIGPPFMVKKFSGSVDLYAVTLAIYSEHCSFGACSADIER